MIEELNVNEFGLNESFNKQHERCKKRLVDLMKSEITLFKIKKSINNNQQELITNVQDNVETTSSLFYFNFFHLSIVEIEILIQKYVLVVQDIRLS